MKPPVDVLNNFLHLHRQAGELRAQLRQVEAGLSKVKDEAMEVFEANGWPRVISVQGGVYIHLAGGSEGPDLEVRGDTGILYVGDLKPATAKQKAGRFVVKAHGQYIQEQASAYSWFQTLELDEALMWETAEQAINDVMLAGLEPFEVIDLHTNESTTYLADGRRA